MPVPTPCRVLVVDDHPDSAESLAEVIRLLGHEAEFLTDPLAVNATVEQFRPHVVLLDIAMPGLDGWSVARTLRQRFPADTLKLVAVTAFTSPKDHIASRQAGFDAHVGKPLDPEIVVRLLEQCFPDDLRPR
jgi:CheY-like chemotaxis protein